MIEIGKNPLTDTNIKLICKIFNVNENWIKTGEDPIFWLDEPPGTDELLDIYRALLPKNQNRLLNHSRDMLEMQNEAMGNGSNRENEISPESDEKREKLDA